MKDGIKQVLQKIKSEHGDVIFGNPQFKGALMDACTDKKLRSLLSVSVLEMKAFSRLQSARDNNIPSAVNLLADEMNSEYMIDRKVSQTVMEALAESMGYEAFPSLPEQEGKQTLPYQRPHLEKEDAVKGAIIPFGRYYWRILDLTDNTAFLISEKITALRPYHSKRVNITWEYSALREYLNNEFYNSAFTSYEWDYIETSKLYTIDYAKDDDTERLKEAGMVPPDRPDGYYTYDKVFLLDIRQAKSFFKKVDHRVTTYMDLTVDGSKSSVKPWWLRSGANKDADIISGSGFLSTSPVNEINGLRPCLRLNLDYFF